jgi:hypothetical protein
VTSRWASARIFIHRLSKKPSEEDRRECMHPEIGKTGGETLLKRVLRINEICYVMHAFRWNEQLQKSLTEHSPERNKLSLRIEVFNGMHLYYTN